MKKQWHIFFSLVASLWPIFWKTRTRREMRVFCSIVIWGDFELWKIADLTENKKVGKFTLNLLRKEHIFLLEKGYEILWKISAAQVKFMTDHQRDKRKGVYKKFSQNKTFFHSCLIWLFTEHSQRLAKSKKSGLGSVWRLVCCDVSFSVHRCSLLFIWFTRSTQGLDVPQNLNCHFLGLIRKESFHNGRVLIDVIYWG